MRKKQVWEPTHVDWTLGSRPGRWGQEHRDTSEWSVRSAAQRVKMSPKQIWKNETNQMHSVAVNTQGVTMCNSKNIGKWLHQFLHGTLVCVPHFQQQLLTQSVALRRGWRPYGRTGKTGRSKDMNETIWTAEETKEKRSDKKKIHWKKKLSSFFSYGIHCKSLHTFWTLL